MDGYECPVACTRCGKIEDLDDMNFRVEGYCECRSGCSHGVCDECAEAIEIELEAKNAAAQASD